MWSLGDYGQIARITEVAAGELAEACGIASGMEVLDVAAGNGNFAVAAARRGAKGVASHLTPPMIDPGRGRCEAGSPRGGWLRGGGGGPPVGGRRLGCFAPHVGPM